MSFTKEEKSALSGCFVISWTALVTTPMWLALLFGILSSVSAPVWMWCLYWVYVPSVIVGIVGAAAVKVITE